MAVAVIFVVLFVGLFVAAFISKRRFGLLALGLAAGSLLAGVWSANIAMILEGAGVSLVEPPLESLVVVCLTVFPALLLMLGGNTYGSKPQRMFGSILFAALAVALLVESVGSGLVIEGDGQVIYDNLRSYASYIVAGGLVFAIIEIMFTKSKSKGER